MLPICSSGRSLDSRSPKERGELCLWFREAGILHQERDQQCVCVHLCVHLKPVMSPSKSSDCVACHITGRGNMLRYRYPSVTLSKQMERKTRPGIRTDIWKGFESLSYSHASFNIFPGQYFFKCVMFTRNNMYTCVWLIK